MAEKRAKTVRSQKPASKKKSAATSPRASATRTPVKRAPANRAPAKRVPAQRVPAQRAPAKSVPAKKASKKVVGTIARKPQPVEGVVNVVERALEDIKAVNVRILDVRKLTDIADTLVIASGNSDRHVRSIADRVVEFAKKAGFRPMGVEGERDGEWVLVDLQDVIVHIMLPRVREFYRLESLWDVSAARREAAAGGE
jgi:ribosome-associated protein